MILLIGNAQDRQIHRDRSGLVVSKLVIANRNRASSWAKENVLELEIYLQFNYIHNFEYIKNH